MNRTILLPGQVALLHSDGLIQGRIENPGEQRKAVLHNFTAFVGTDSECDAEVARLNLQPKPATPPE